MTMMMTTVQHTLVMTMMMTTVYLGLTMMMTTVYLGSDYDDDYCIPWF